MEYVRGVEAVGGPSDAGPGSAQPRFVSITSAVTGLLFNPCKGLVYARSSKPFTWVTSLNPHRTEM